jgi:hypothetical protein
MTESGIGASFYSYPATQTTFTGYTLPPLGNCVVIPPVPTTNPTLPTALDADAISVTGPAGTQQIPEVVTGAYSLQPSSTFFPATFGTFTFTGAGGKDVGPFTVSISYSNPLSWTNMNAITSITRSQGVTIDWTGGASGTYVYIYGSPSNNTGTLSVGFACYAPVSANQFTIPSYALLALPPSSSANGSLTVDNYAPSQPFSATGLTTGNALAHAGVGFSISSAYQ